jgi:CRISPR/Cas system CMR-associated protein Cmr1 (group 7 of RAMP superfamily)
LDGKGISGNKFDYFLWPMRAPQKGIRGVIDQGQIIELRFSMKKVKTDTVFPDQVLKAFLLLGSMGTRSRRCYGGVYPVDVEIDGEKWAIPNSLDSFTEELEDILDEYSNCKIIQVASPQRDWLGAVNKAADFLKRFRCGKSNPKFHQQASKWGQNDHDIRFDRDKDNCIYRASLGLPLNQRYSDRTNLSSLIEGKKRLASPMLLKILALNEGFIPIAVFFRDKFLEEGELVKIEGNGIRKEREASNDLLHTMMYPDDEEHRNIWRESQSLADFKRNA